MLSWVIISAVNCEFIFVLREVTTTPLTSTLLESKHTLNISGTKRSIHKSLKVVDQTFNTIGGQKQMNFYNWTRTIIPFESKLPPLLRILVDNQLSDSDIAVCFADSSPNSQIVRESEYSGPRGMRFRLSYKCCFKPVVRSRAQLGKFLTPKGQRLETIPEVPEEDEDPESMGNI